MNYNNYSDRKGSTYIMRMVCAILFCGFTFVYLYFYQADMLAVAQHILSGGATTYDGLIGAVIITAVLQLVQVGIFSVMPLSGNFHALTYFPSALLLALLASMEPAEGGIVGLGFAWWLAILLLLLWGGACIMLLRLPEASAWSGSPTFLLSASAWRNLLCMALLFLFIGLAGNNDAVMHYRMKAEVCLTEDDPKGATAVGRRSHEADAGLTMLRFFALAREGRLADELFKYPVCGTSGDMIPLPGGAECLLYPADSIYKFLGAKPARPMAARLYLHALLRTGLASDAVKDYLLCGYLVDRDIDAFAKALPSFYEISDKLPLHYREALTLYTHLRANPVVVYHNDVMDTDYEDLQRLERMHNQREARKNALHSQYAGTYWWYYEYGG